MNGVKLIALSMRPSMIYSTAGVADISKVFLPNALIQGEVEGKEDYGYTVNVGFNETKGFFKCDTSVVDCRNCSLSSSPRSGWNAAFLRRGRAEGPRAAARRGQGQSCHQSDFPFSARFLAHR